MTRTANARIAGFAFLFYIAVGITQMVLTGGATSGADTGAKLASIAGHAAVLRVNMLLTLLTSFTALALAVSLYAITRDEDRELAMFGMLCRVGEGLSAGASLLATIGLLYLAAPDTVRAPDAAASQAIAGVLLRVRGSNVTIGATFFSVGSLAFSYLLLRGRMVPGPLAWLGVGASVLLVICLPAQLAGVLPSPMAQVMWLPMLAFEVPLGVWFLTKGVPLEATSPT